MNYCPRIKPADVGFNKTSAKQKSLGSPDIVLDLFVRFVLFRSAG